MSLAIITAIRQLPQLKGALKFTAIELAHRASSAGHVRVAYSYLAQKTGLSVRTMIRHVQRLEDLGVLRKQRVWISAKRCAVNVYLLLVRPLHRCASDNVAKNLPEPKKEEEKCGTLGDAIATLERGMRLLTAGSVPYTSCLERLQTLNALVPRSG
jgi:Helix-turn-helix domain